MRSFHLVDPELRAAVEAMPPSAGLTRDILPMARQAYEEAIARPPLPEGVSERDIWVDGPAGPESLRLYVLEKKPSDAPVPLVYDIHGGGYIMGVPELCREGFAPLVAETGVTVVSVDYRLSPETAHPDVIEDCYAGLKWAYDNAEALGIDRDRIAIRGGSAGGGLAAALAILARDRGEVPIVFQQLLCPMLDDRTAVTTDPHPFTGEFNWTAELNHFGWEALLGQAPGGDDISAYAAPARAEDLSNLPPAYIDTGALDLFLEEDLEYARRLSRAGVPVELHVFAGAYHGFQMTADCYLTREAVRISNAALLRALFN